MDGPVPRTYSRFRFHSPLRGAAVGCDNWVRAPTGDPVVVPEIQRQPAPHPSIRRPEASPDTRMSARTAATTATTATTTDTNELCSPPNRPGIVAAIRTYEQTSN